MRVGYVVGVFDCFHYGHRAIIHKAMKQCDKLIVAVHSDEFTKSYKRLPIQNESTRKQQIEEAFHISVEIIDDNHIVLIQKYKVNVIFHGNDWEIESYKKQIRYYESGMDELNVSIEMIPYTRGISTTKIIQNSLPSLKDIQSIYFDLDKTLILDHQPCLFAKECWELCNLKYNQNVKVITNNNRYSPEEIYEELLHLGFNIQPEQIFTSLHQVLEFYRTLDNDRTFIWGTESAKKYLIQHGVTVDQTNPEFIVLLYRNDYNYNELVKIMTWIANGIPYIVGNTDITYPDTTNKLPDTGAIHHLILDVTKKEPMICLGKSSYRFGTFKENASILMIGDNPLTDKLFAKNNNMKFIQVGDDEDSDISHLGVLIDYIQ